MLRLPKLIPKLTFNKQELIDHITNISNDFNISKKRLDSWITLINQLDTRGYYFFGLIYVKYKQSPYIRPLVFTHELLHHVDQNLRSLGLHTFIFDVIIDIVWLLIFNRKKIETFEQLFK